MYPHVSVGHGRREAGLIDMKRSGKRCARRLESILGSPTDWALREEPIGFCAPLKLPPRKRSWLCQQKSAANVRGRAKGTRMPRKGLNREAQTYGRILSTASCDVSDPRSLGWPMMVPVVQAPTKDAHSASTRCSLRAALGPVKPSNPPSGCSASTGKSTVSIPIA